MEEAVSAVEGVEQRLADNIQAHLLSLELLPSDARGSRQRSIDAAIRNALALDPLLFRDAPPFLAPLDPGGLGSEQMRGFGLFFLRWLLDHHAGDDPAAFVRALASGGGGQRQGIANVENETGRAWEDLIAEILRETPVVD